MISVHAIAIAAQDVEMQPFLDVLEGKVSAATDAAHADRSNDGSASLIGNTRRIEEVSAPTGLARLAHVMGGRILAIRTGIGQTATASALGWALTRYSPRCVVSIGSAGGLAQSVNVRDVVAGSAYGYGSADATAFGYARGQIPGQPITFPGDEDLLAHASSYARVGLMLSGDSFVTARNVGDMREAFPDALTTDMESAAAAQTCTAWGVPFVSIRCVSDLCGPAANQDYHVAIEDAAIASATAAVRTIGAYVVRPMRARAPLFGRSAVKAALLLILAKLRNLEPSANLAAIPPGIEGAARHHLANKPEFVDEAVGLIAAAQEEIAKFPDITITAKNYDAARAELLASLGTTQDRGQISWPPTSQTVSKRSNGYWNDALAQLGLKVKTGRHRGPAKFTEADYLETMRTFTTWAKNLDLTPSVTAYGRWLDEGFAGGDRPSAAAIRQRYGTWRSAVTMALD